MYGLTGRLARVAELVGSACTLADIGSDHGLLPIALLKQGRIVKAVAVELTQGPYEAVSRAIAGAGLSDHMEARLGDGCGPLLPEEADVIAIAGMGGNTMWSILTSIDAQRAFGTRPPRLVLQPMNGAGLIRYFAQCAGYTIRADVRVQEAGVLYECLALDPLPAIRSWQAPAPEARAAYEALSASDRMRYLCGELGLQMRCQLLGLQLQMEMAKREAMMQSLAYPLAERAKERLAQIQKEHTALAHLQSTLTSPLPE